LGPARAGERHVGGRRRRWREAVRGHGEEGPEGRIEKTMKKAVAMLAELRHTVGRWDRDSISAPARGGEESIRTAIRPSASKHHVHYAIARHHSQRPKRLYIFKRPLDVVAELRHSMGVKNNGGIGLPGQNRKEQTMSKKNNNGAGGRKPLADPKGAERRIRAWLLRTCPEEKPMIGDFRKDVTFAEVNRRMHGGENFYDICDCSESVQREIVFRELARLYGTKYDYWYDLWLHS
ncbi:MAG: hypothetical protein J5963_07500, partial [Schwartzia sp.]|nr:hypothetical protein [Schwartzia sp. (in: firmicutes)]